MGFIRKAVATVAMMFALGVAQAQNGYEELAAPQKTASEGKVEVIEFFWYGCPHCYQFEPYIGPWHDEAPDNVEFIRMAPPLNPAWKVHSQAFYAAELMGVTEQFHEPFFNAIHRDKKRMRKPSDIASFVATLGIDAEQFEKNMKSFAVDAKIRQSMQKARDYKISAVPSVIINGKYKTSGSHAGSYPELIKVLNMLVSQESAG
jgi:thiol:disulfide interchange protein DsbA